MKKFIVLIMMLLATSAYAVEYNSDSIVLDASKLLEVSVHDVEGASAIDTYPVGNPDGWIPKADSVYFDGGKADLGQVELYKDKSNNTVKKYDGYVDGSFQGKSWNQLSSYWKMSFHMTKENSTTNIGYKVLIKCKVDTTIQEHFDWDSTMSKDGFNDVTAVIFTDDLIEVNTRYLFGHENAGTSLMSSAIAPNNKTIWISMFISDQAVYDKLITDLETWNNAPNLTKVSDRKWSK